MFQSESIETGTLIEYSINSHNYDIGYIRKINIYYDGSKDYSVYWFLSKYDTIEDERSLSHWDWSSCKVHSVKHADTQQ